jgi:hypothetical protein
MVKKIRKMPIPLVKGQIAPCSYEAKCALGKLFECEIQVMKKI